MTTEPAIIDERSRADALGRSSLLLWLVFLVPPALALGNLQFGYVLAHIACSTRWKLPIHIFMLVCFLIVVVAGLLARREWSALGEEDPGQLGGPVGSRRLMALLGMVGAAISAFIILAQWLPAFLLGPCVRT